MKGGLDRGAWNALVYELYCSFPKLLLAAAADDVLDVVAGKHHAPRSIDRSRNQICPSHLHQAYGAQMRHMIDVSVTSKAFPNIHQSHANMPMLHSE